MGYKELQTELKKFGFRIVNKDCTDVIYEETNQLMSFLDEREVESFLAGIRYGILVSQAQLRKYLAQNT